VLSLSTAVFFRRRIVDKFGLLDNDYITPWIRILDKVGTRRGKFCLSPTVLAGSRLYKEIKTIASRVKVHSEINDMLRERLGRVPDKWLFNYAHVVLETRNVAHRPISFILNLSAMSLYSSLRWNRSISRNMLGTVSRWIEKYASFSEGKVLTVKMLRRESNESLKAH